MAESQAPDVRTETVVNVLTATSSDLQKKLSRLELTSVDLVKAYLDQIKKHNHSGLKLNAVISTAPVDQLLAQAEALDNERSAGQVRGHLHGIPILVKDNIMTEEALGMDTTCGAYALVGSKAKKNATVIDNILNAGMLVLGKANLSEWAGRMGYGLPGGWSAVGGQTQTPYVIGGFAKGGRFIGHSEGQRIAFVDPTIWYIREGPWDPVPDIMNKQFADIAAARDLIQSNGGKVVKDVQLPSFDTLDFEGFADPQALLEDAICNRDRLSDEKYEEAKAFVRKGARTNGYDKIFKEHGVDIVAGPLDSRMGSMAATAGLPSATVPLGYADFFNGRAYGLSIIAGAGREDKLVEFMSAWEASHPGLWKPPAQLAHSASSNL
ncbi:hypothetical protein FQN54_009587 [Arachnomyces sp. PD_36]|nr:hypothetical protein FQN54_009587 [Arachnomyces sp. PD_36]